MTHVRRTIDNDASMRVPWKQVAAGSGVVAISSLTALVVIVGTSDADVLATVALALAVLSFTMQLLIFTIQSWSSTQQLRQSESLNAETIALLADVRADVGGTRDMVSEHFSELLGAVVSRSLPRVEKAAGAPDQDGLADVVRETLTELSAAVATASTASPPLPAQGPSPATPEELAAFDQRVNYLTTWPEGEDADSARDLYASIPENLRYAHAYAADSELRAARAHRSPRNPAIANDAQLVDLGLEVIREVGGSAFAFLTEAGLSAARLAIAPDPVPDEFKGLGIYRWDEHRRVEQQRQAIERELIRRAIRRDTPDETVSS